MPSRSIRHSTRQRPDQRREMVCQRRPALQHLQPCEVAARKARQERRGASVFPERHAARRQERAVQRQLLPIASASRQVADSIVLRRANIIIPNRSLGIILSPQERRQDFFCARRNKRFSKKASMSIFFSKFVSHNSNSLFFSSGASQRRHNDRQRTR